MPCPPTCTVCHRDANGGFFTVVKPFGQAMIDVGGLSARSPEEIPGALQALDAAKTDSDGDGASDVDELRAGEDPNRPGAQSLCGPVYGCGARVAPADPPWHASLLFLAAALVLALRSRARRRS
jgi:MYXO-CTERM domain-containing protein